MPVDSSVFVNLREHVGPDHAALVWAIEQINAGAAEGIDFGGRAWNVGAELPAITADNVVLRGDGATLNVQHGGRALVFGTATDACTRTTIRDLHINYSVPSDGVSPAVDFVHAVRVEWADSSWLNVGIAARFGEATTKAHRCVLSHIDISLDAAGAMADGNIQLRNASSTRLSNVHLNGRFASKGSIVRIAPHVVGALVDTAWITDCSFQCFAVSTPGSADGKDFGLLLDLTHGECQNVWVSNSVFDHAKVASIKVVAPVGAKGFARFFRVLDSRLDADASAAKTGQCIVVDNPGGVVLDGFQFVGNAGWVSAPVSAIVINDPKRTMRATLISDNRILATSALVKPAAISINSDRFQCVGNYVGRSVTGGGKWAAALQILHRDATLFTATGNLAEETATPGVAVIQPAYSAPSAGRVVSGNGCP